MIYSLFLVRCRFSVVSLSFLRMRISSEKKHMSIPDLTDRARKNSSFLMGITISDSDIFLMSESSIWWYFLSDSTNAFYSWDFLMVFKSGLIDWILRLVQTRRATNMILELFVLHWLSIKMRSIVPSVSVQAPRDCGLQYRSLYCIFIFLGY